MKLLIHIIIAFASTQYCDSVDNTVDLEHPSSLRGKLAATISAKDMTLDQLWNRKKLSLDIRPEVDFEMGTYQLSTIVEVNDATVSFVLKLQKSDDYNLARVGALLNNWPEDEIVELIWGDDAFKLDNTKQPIQIAEGQLLQTLQDPSISTICGTQKVVAPVTLLVGQERYPGTVKIGQVSSGLQATTVKRALTGDGPSTTQEADNACPHSSFLFIDWCKTDHCNFILPADPKITGTCTLGGAAAGLGATGTPWLLGGGADVGVTMTTTAQCWNEFSGTCQFVSYIWGDYCTCVPNAAPNLKCGGVPDPCAGTPGGPCNNPKWKCGPVSDTPSMVPVSF